jgi:hypothetical protein
MPNGLAISMRGKSSTCRTVVVNKLAVYDRKSWSQTRRGKSGHSASRRLAAHQHSQAKVSGVRFLLPISVSATKIMLCQAANILR